MEATLVKTDKIRGLKQLFTPCFLLIGKKNQNNNNYRIAHQKNHVKNNDDQTFNLFFFYLGFIPCKAEQPLWDMELEQKEPQKD